MIDEAIGKILGMAMAYAVSSLGLFLAYVNYRRRTLRAERVMTPTAWAVVGVVLVSIAAGVGVVAQLAQPPSEAPAAVEVPAPIDIAAPAPAPPDSAPPAPAVPRDRWPVLGIVLPAGVLLFATWMTSALYLHFSRADSNPS